MKELELGMPDVLVEPVGCDIELPIDDDDPLTKELELGIPDVLVEPVGCDIELNADDDDTLDEVCCGIDELLPTVGKSI
ncbi:hypothetical protein G6F56_013439 [Rhizopus delemar]|nr:hypothetical protein G6F56_013439 [Rhizopus delemar]